MSDNEKPLVTFALFAYNQEQFVREAIEGAFAQTYEPLEIILSDDCSMDRTFEIMQEMAAGYEGPHRVLARKTQANRGSLLHVAEVAAIAHGALLILAAGDDVSISNRTEKLVMTWMTTRAWGLYSRHDRISESGAIISRRDEVKILASPQYRLRQYFLTRRNEIRIIHGATSAYDRRLFDFLDTTPADYILSEDGALSVLLNLLNKEIKFLDDSLVLYRESEQSLTQGTRSGPLTYEAARSDELAIQRFARSQANRCNLFLRMNDKYGQESNVTLDVAAIQDDRERQTIRSKWWCSLTLCDKFNYLLRLRNLQDQKWSIPRMLPNPIFLYTKVIFKKIVSIKNMCLLK